MDFSEVSPEKESHQSPDKVLYKTVSESAVPVLDDRTRWRITFRLLVIGILLGIRGITAYSTPDLFIQSKVVATQVDSHALYAISDLMWVRGMLLSIVLPCYLYSLVAGRYLRFMSVIGMVVGCALLWSDMELFMLSSMSELTTVSVALFGMRLIAVWLLVLNYLDIHH